MTDDFDDAKPAGAADPFAVHIAAAASGAAAEEARAYLREQAELAWLQKQNLTEQNAFELSHLRWRRFNDQLSGALRAIAAIFGLLLLVGLGVLLWRAHEADGLVIESFSVPPSFARLGMNGDVVAGDITNSVMQIRDYVLANSLSATKDVNAENTDSASVEIPDTGVSLAEAWRLLRGWLGSERHVTGSVRELGHGQVALEADVSGAPSILLTGAASDLAKLETQAGERIFSDLDPLNWSVYLFYNGRYAEANAAAARYTGMQNTPNARGVGYSLWGLTTWLATGDLRLEMARERLGEALDPGDLIIPGTLGNGYEVSGDAEDELREREATLAMKQGSYSTHPIAGRTVEFERQRATQDIAALKGDFAQAVGLGCYLTCTDEMMFISRAKAAARLHDPAGARALLEQAAAAGSVPQDNPQELRYYHAEARYYIAVARQDWRAANAAAALADTAFRQWRGAIYLPGLALMLQSSIDPLMAVAAARVGDFTNAHRIADATAAYCYDCVRVRGQIDALQKKSAAAAYWFARAVKQAPDIPFASADWGEMLLREGKYDDAIAKFEAANRKGPHFADPLEMWGEALIAKDRSDLALAKFAEADKYVPNWGRLHLKWGEALLWSGDKSGAQKQFAIAAHLDLTRSEKSELAKERGHG
jgi:tetratricopeptide (TPR) repeat protein